MAAGVLRGRRPASAPHLAILGAAFFFGTTFVTVKSAVEEAEPVPFLGARFTLGALILGVTLWRRPPAADARLGHAGWRAGLTAGTALLAGYVFQTIGLQYTTGSVSAFITYLLVVIVPVMHAVLVRRLPHPAVAAGVALATTGLFLLSGAGNSVGLFGRGEVLTLGCAVAFAVHVIVLSGSAAGHDPLSLAAVQLSVVGVGCLVPGFWLGGYAFTAKTWLAVVYTAAAASALAYFLQTWGQARLHPTRSALILMLEPVFAAALGFAVGDRLGLVGVLGGLLILGGIGLAEWAGSLRGTARC